MSLMKTKVESRRVQTGALENDGLRVISSGLKAGEWVVVGGLQQVRPHVTVQAEKVEMPSLGGPSEAGQSQTAAGAGDSGKSNGSGGSNNVSNNVSAATGNSPAGGAQVTKSAAEKSDSKQQAPHHAELR